MIRIKINLVLSQDTLKGLNRGALILHDERRFMLCLAHFKSGQTGLTRDQLQQASRFLGDAQPSAWAIRLRQLQRPHRARRFARRHLLG